MEDHIGVEPVQRELCRALTDFEIQSNDFQKAPFGRSVTIRPKRWAQRSLAVRSKAGIREASRSMQVFLGQLFRSRRLESGTGSLIKRHLCAVGRKREQAKIRETK